MEKDTLQQTTLEGWKKYYAAYEPGASPGLQYPTDILVKYVSNLRKNAQTIGEYFDDEGQELSIKGNYSGNALEFGFGAIANLKMVSEKGFDCYGLEVSEEAVSRGQDALEQENIARIQLQLWEPPKVPFESNFFALVYGLGCIYYNLELEKVIEEIYRVMADDATFLFSFFGSKHDYMQYIDYVSDRTYQWSDNHFNPRLSGIYLRCPQTKDEVMDLFSSFRDVSVFTWETDQLLYYQSFWFATGKK